MGKLSSKETTAFIKGEQQILFCGLSGQSEDTKNTIYVCGVYES